MSSPSSPANSKWVTKRLRRTLSFELQTPKSDCNPECSQITNTRSIPSTPQDVEENLDMDAKLISDLLTNTKPEVTTYDEMSLDEALFDVDWGSFYFTTQVTPVKNSSSVVLADQAKPVNATQETSPAVDPKTIDDPEDDPIDDDYSCYSQNTLISWANHNPWESELSPEPLSAEIEYGTPRSFLD